MTPRIRAKGYSLEIEDPRTGATSLERHISLAAALACAAKLIQAGYNIGIWSAASHEQRPEQPIAANDDVWTGAVSKRPSG